MGLFTSCPEDFPVRELTMPEKAVIAAESLVVQMKRYRDALLTESDLDFTDMMNHTDDSDRWDMILAAERMSAEELEKVEVDFGTPVNQG